MRAFDVIGIGSALVLVAALCWGLGRYAGRRDWRISSILVASVLMALTVQIDVLALIAWYEGRAGAGIEAFMMRLGRRLTEAALSPEFSVFLMIFGAFLGMLGWSATPARKPEVPVSTG